MSWLRIVRWLLGGAAADTAAPPEPSRPRALAPPPSPSPAPTQAARRNKEPAPPGRAFQLGRGSGGFDLKVVGESNYEDTLDRLHSDLDDGRKYLTCRFYVKREPTNEHDENAIVVVTHEGDTVGYFSRSDAKRYENVIETLAREYDTLWCRGRLLGGDWDKPSIGVVLDVMSPKELLKAVTTPDAVDELTILKREKRYDELEKRLLEMVVATEADAKRHPSGVAPRAYHELAVLYRTTKRPTQELEILERCMSQPPAPGVTRAKLKARLEKLKQTTAQADGDVDGGREPTT